MGSPEALYLLTGHRTSVVYFPKVRNAAFEFFARRFAAAASRAGDELTVGARAAAIGRGDRAMVARS